MCKRICAFLIPVCHQQYQKIVIVMLAGAEKVWVFELQKLCLM